MNKTGKWVMIAVSAGLLSVIVYRFVHHPVQQKVTVSQGATTARVYVSHPVYAPISQSITLTADIQPINQAAIYSQVSGYLDEISVRRGYHVKKGQVLAKINDTTYRAQLQQAQATMNYTCKNAERYKKLVAKNLVSLDSYDLAKEQCEQSRAAVTYAKKNLAYTEITAPFSGYIFNRMVDKGATIPATTGAIASGQSPLFTIVDVHTVKIVISVPESQVRFLHIGLPLQVIADAYPGKVFPGKITRMNPALDIQTRTLAVEIDMDNSAGLLKPGMFARAVLLLQTIPHALTVPNEALLNRNGDYYLYRVEGGIAHRVKVKLGVRGKKHVQILSGISPDDQIVVLGQQHLAEGERVDAKPYVADSSSDSHRTS
ncbi:MAG: efflux RND transporter periplasmic adaptor subunit [Nitrospiraceae bacterium]|jgi:membrane fusion protein (multidrug efflux system)|nr:efflux RND transporter periplasmic adaptor subunit [Nitrospiraceae bacterium]